MNKEQIIKKIKDIEWYRQAVDSRAFYLWTPAFAVTDEFGPPALYLFIKERFEGYYVKKTLAGQAKAFMEKAKKDKKAVYDYYNKLNKALEKLDKLFAELSKVNFEGLEEKEVLKLLRKFDELTYDFWYVNWLCDKFDPEGHEMLKKEIIEAGANLTDEEIEHLTLPAKPNFMDHSELDLYRLAKKLKGNKFSDDELIEKLKDYAKKYFYVRNSWSIVKILKEKDFLQSLKQVMEEPIGQIDKRIEWIENKTTNFNKKSEKIIKDKNINEELQNVFYMYRRLSEARDIRKEYVLKSNHYYYLFAKRLSEIYNIDVKIMLRAIPREVFNCKNTGKLKETLKKREKAVLFIDSSGYYILNGKDAEEIKLLLHRLFLDKFNEIKGFCASKGKAKGIVKIVCGHTHFSKFNEGDILVANMTRPEYVPLMKKARAIITDEGGLTSHAAIISRELNKPCIVGTQVATNKLADGDLVEVDADNGIVKIMKK